MTTTAFERHLAACRAGPDDCWPWPRVLCTGWSKTYYRGRLEGAHRAVYLELVGAVPEGLELDHLCRNGRCVNPKHLEPVTPRENKRRSNSPMAINSRKTHCPKGHAYTDESWYTPPGLAPRRVCRPCHAALLRAKYVPRPPRPRTTHCGRGHSFTDAWIDRNGGRTCRGCRDERLGYKSARRHQ